MNDAHDYSELLMSEDGISDTWREIYEEGMPLSWNLINILKCTIFLPHDFYDIIAAYYLLPSALCRIVPYLFLFGQSGSGKSTVAKIGSYLHDVDINSSSDTFAAIRNSLEERRYGKAQVLDDQSPGGYYIKSVERNTCMVWDDIDSSVFTSSPDLYRLFKFGYSRSTDKITISTGEVGQNISFHTFCPKVFSSISPLHLDERFKELQRRLIVVPCRRIEELTEKRKQQLGIDNDDWQSKLIDLEAYDWKGFNRLHYSFWEPANARRFISNRKTLVKMKTGLNSQQRSISLDIVATGVTAEVWQDFDHALSRMKAYWNWFKQELSQNAGLSGLLKNYLQQEAVNAKNGNKPLEVYSAQIRQQIALWVEQGWLYEKPRPSQVKQAMLDLGMRLQHGIWKRE